MEREGEKRRKEREKKEKVLRNMQSMFATHYLSIYLLGYLSITLAIYTYIQFETRKVQKFRRLNLHYPTPLGRVLQSELVCMFVYVCVFVCV